MTSLKLTPVVFIGIFAASILFCGSLMEVEGEDMKDMEAGEMMMGEGSVFGCDRCGAQCKLKCGTRRFRSCCLHFLRKRSPNSNKKLYHDIRIKQNLQQQQQQQQIQPQLQPQPYKTTGSVETSFQELLAHLLSLSDNGNSPGSVESDYAPNDAFP